MSYFFKMASPHPPTGESIWYGLSRYFLDFSMLLLDWNLFSGVFVASRTPSDGDQRASVKRKGNMMLIQ